MKQRFPKGLVVSELTTKSMVASSKSAQAIELCLTMWEVEHKTELLDKKRKTRFTIDPKYMVSRDKVGYFLADDPSALTIKVATTKHEVFSLTVESEVRLMSAMCNQLRCSSELQTYVEKLLNDHSVQYRIDLVCDGTWCLVHVLDHIWEVIDSDGSQKCILFNYKIDEVCMK